MVVDSIMECTFIIVVGVYGIYYYYYYYLWVLLALRRGQLVVLLLDHLQQQ